MADLAAPQTLRFHQPLGRVTRIAIAIGGALTLLAPYELLIKPGGPVFTLAMLPFWAIALGALSVGAVFMGAALLGLSKTVGFDAARRVMDVRGDALFGLGFRRSYAFAALGAVTVREDNYTDGPPLYRVEIALPGAARPFEIESSESRAKAEATADTVRALLRG